MKKILITGASGFIGSFIVEEALRQGFDTWAVVRPTSSRKYLQDSRIHFIELDFSSEERLEKELASHEFNYIVHAAGATKCLHKEDFFRINTEGTKNFIRAIQALNMPLERFVYLSSLSVFGAIREEEPYREILESDTPMPNTAYGKSKLEAEKYLESLPSSLHHEEKTPRSEGYSANTECLSTKNDFISTKKIRLSTENGELSTEKDKQKNRAVFPFIILRPTGVYGPREKDYFLMAKSIKGHTDFAVGFKRQDITFVYVKDVVQAVFLALTRGKDGRAYFLSDGNVYQSSTFSNLIHEELGRPWWIRITAPIWLLRIITFFGDLFGRITGKISALNNDKYQILKQRNWRCNIQPTVDELGYKPEYDLKRGVKETIKWYKEERWI
ncbi:NAD(P)-dependent oxidoreductase [Prevotella sp. HUN102]|uniref:NAD-dependent epimerase/dehydratase family protein n=1 Tax=Prevotella sp. HUN102 TaxID=1392486 RepID=UPI000491409D|nr:NAD(P)-dependent oxidoreductase [Prevotella sp. HUN102]